MHQLAASVPITDPPSITVRNRFAAARNLSTCLMRWDGSRQHQWKTLDTHTCRKNACCLPQGYLAACAKAGHGQ